MQLESKSINVVQAIKVVLPAQCMYILVYLRNGNLQFCILAQWQGS